jgi:haloacetate dehalogenase
MPLPGFEYQRVDVEGVIINCAVKGSGPPVLLLHGYPENLAAGTASPST